MVRRGLALHLCLLYGLTALVFAEKSSNLNDGDLPSVDNVESARCRVRCLALLKHKLGSSEAEVAGDNGHTSLAKCLEDLPCTACLKPCGQPGNLGQCVQQICQTNEDDCEQSCRFVKHLRTVYPGICPAPREVSGLDAACVEECDHDDECDQDKKCCYNGCGYTCQEPKDLYFGVPQVPKFVNVRERSKGSAMEVTWKAVVLNVSAPVLYIVQSRYSIGYHYSEQHATPWKQISQTTHTSLVVRDVGPGKWYQYQVAAVSINGTRSFTDPTKPLKLSKEPVAPSAPVNLTEGQTVIEKDKISITIHWKPPKKSDLPVHRYKVFWSKRLKSVTAELQFLRENKKVVSHDELQFKLENLDQDTTYFVQVQAISAYGHVRLKSERAGVYITTYALPQATQNAGPTPQVVIHGASLPTLAPLQNISIHYPFYRHGLLRANVSWILPPEYDECGLRKVLLHWSPEVCIADGTGAKPGFSKPVSATTHNNNFEIYDLRFDCRYNVKAQPVCEGDKVGAVAHATFHTPSCGEVTVYGNTKPDCPTNVPRVPDTVEDIEHSFIIVNTNITARISWKLPLSDAPLTGYRFIWGQMVDVQDSASTSSQPIMDQNTALQKVLPDSTATSFSIGNLKEATGYIVRTQALSQAGSGQVATIFFTTPMLQTPIQGPPYKTHVDVDKHGVGSPAGGPDPAEGAAGGRASAEPPHSTWYPAELSGTSSSSVHHLSAVVTLVSVILLLSC